ncbi:MAG: aminoglycoside phosphotransferase family protein [Clostridia bacterium]|nr:aminoglycoside phosphotransferase family protein [Clostridia bacterium]
MTEDLIVKLFAKTGMGTVSSPITPVTGGLLHRTYKVNTENASYAVKHLNPNVMRRADAMGNLKRAESYEKLLEDAGIPVIPAIAVKGEKMRETDGEYFYIFHWQNGSITDPNGIIADQCLRVGNILGRIHAVDPREVPKTEPEIFTADPAGYAAAAASQNAEIASLLGENEELLRHAERRLNEARAALPPIECVTDGDMDPKNVMWERGEPFVIDLECLDRGNPVSDALLLSLAWSGVETLDLDTDKLKAFFDGYLEAYDNGFRDYGSVFGLAYTRLEWLEYNVRRALGECEDEAERALGVSEVKSSLRIIAYIRSVENETARQLDLWFK